MRVIDGNSPQIPTPFAGATRYLSASGPLKPILTVGMVSGLRH
jgi:hypothetical protein